MKSRHAVFALTFLVLSSADAALAATKSGKQPVAGNSAQPQPAATHEDDYISTFVPPKKGIKGIVTLPEPSRVLPEENCSKDDLAIITRIVPQRVACFGSVTSGQSNYIFVQNWLATEAEPGVIQVISGDAPIGSIAGSTGGWVSIIEKRSGGLEVISIAPKSNVSAGSLPYLRYSLTGKRITLISDKMFPAGSSPIDENRRRFAANSTSVTVPIASAPARTAAVSGTNRAPTGAANPHCSFAQWSGDVPNIVDLFLCDETRAIETFSRGARFVLKPDTVRFTDGKYFVRMTLRPSATSSSVNRMQNKFNWNDWVYATQNIASTEVFCAFNSNPVAKGQTAVVYGKLDTYSASRIILVCSRI